MIAVTGAGGFLGRRLVAALAARGEAVVALVRDGSRGEVAGAASQGIFCAGQPVSLAGVKAIVHAAAYRPARPDDPEEASRCLAINAAGTARLLEDAVAAGVEHFVYVGAGNVYVPQAHPARETDPVWPSHRAAYYLGSKLCGEFFVSAEGARNRILTTTVRPSAIYGPGMPPGLVATFVSRLRADQSVSVADGGRYAADLVYVDDVATAIAVLIERRQPGTFNLGSGELVTSLQLAEILCDRYGRARDRIEVAAVRGDPPGFGALDMTLAKRTFGYAPRDIRAGIDAMVMALETEGE